MSNYHLAEFNTARAVAPLADPLLAEFVALLEDVNLAADRSPGFVWRMMSDTEDHAYMPSTSDDRLLLNLTVWESIDALFEYTYRMKDHANVFRKRREWFEAPTGPSHVLWWIPANTRPTVEEAENRLAMLTINGPTEAAFTFKQRFSPPR